MDLDLGAYQDIFWKDGYDAPVRNVFTGSYQVSFSSGGCSFDKTYQIKSIICDDHPIYIPNTFAPNSELNKTGKIFIPEDWTEPIKNKHLRIYDRWGNLVYQRMEDQPLEWDGTSTNGIKLAYGVCSTYSTISYLKNPKHLCTGGTVTIMD